MKKVLIMAKSLGGGGAEVALIELINKLPEKEYSITLALLDADREYMPRLKRNIEIKQIEFTSSIAFKLVSMDCFIAKLLKRFSVNSFIPYYDILLDRVKTHFDSRYDIAIDFFGYGYFLTALLAKRILAKKKGTWLHDEDLYWFKSVARYADDFDKIFAVSRSVRDRFCELYPRLKNKVEVFYNVIDTDMITERAGAKQNVWPNDNAFKILTVGRLTEQKGYDIAIEAASLLNTRQINFKWYAIGTGKNAKRLKKLAIRKRIEDKFIFAGFLANPYPYMKECDLYVQPSRHEGYAISLVEARTLHVPIIVCDIPSAREQIQDKINGYIVPLDANALANKIQELYEKPELRQKVVNSLKSSRIDFSSELRKLDMQ